MVCRTGPTCMAIRSSSLSRRYGVAVSPSQRRAGICLTACILPVEVSGQPPGPVAVQQRIDADVHIALQMSSQHIHGQRQVAPPLMRDPALPPAAHRREPALPASTGILDPGGIDVGARREQRPEERHLRVIGRVFMDRSRRRIEEAGLRRNRRRGLPRAQLQHLQQARVLRPQPRQLRGHGRGKLSHAHNICNPRHVAHAGAPSGSRAPHGGHSAAGAYVRKTLAKMSHASSDLAVKLKAM